MEKIVITKQELEAKKAIALGSEKDFSTKKAAEHRNHKRTNKVNYEVFRKSEDERAQLKAMKKGAIKGTNKLVFQF